MARQNAERGPGSGGVWRPGQQELLLAMREARGVEHLWAGVYWHIYCGGEDGGADDDNPLAPEKLRDFLTHAMARRGLAIERGYPRPLLGPASWLELPEADLDPPPLADQELALLRCFYARDRGEPRKRKLR